jgi:hypothetical protein
VNQRDHTPTITLSDEQKFQAMLVRFQDHTETLRTMSTIDLQVFGGYITLQLALSAWLAEHSPTTVGAHLGIFLVDLALAGLSAKLLYNSYIRRKEVLESLTNILMVLRFRINDFYLSGTSLDSKTKFRPWWYWYLVGIGVGVIGVNLVLWGSPGTFPKAP